MYDCIDQYHQPYDPFEPRVCVDEKPKQLLADTRPPIPGKPGSIAKYDYEYERRGTANVFMAVEPKAGKRMVQVTKRRTMTDFAAFTKHLAEEVYPKARRIHIILDNLNTHKDKALQRAFGEEEAARILQRIEWHYTPIHGSWLNAAEIEIGVMDGQCTGGASRISIRSLPKWTLGQNGGIRTRGLSNGSLHGSRLMKSWESTMSSNQEVRALVLQNLFKRQAYQ